jgi:hypothetical protein
MSDVSSCSSCGQYPTSLFKTTNELQGVEPLSSTERFIKDLTEDRVTLSSDAITLARAEAQTETGVTNLSPVEYSSYSLPNQSNGEGKGSTFYTVV